MACVIRLRGLDWYAHFVVTRRLDEIWGEYGSGLSDEVLAFLRSDAAEGDCAIDDEDDLACFYFTHANTAFAFKLRFA